MPPTKAMTKYRDKVPQAPREASPAEILFASTRDEWRPKSLDELTAEYNRLEVIEKEQAAVLAKTKTQMDAIESLIQLKIEATDADNLTINGYTWTPKADAYASASDPQALVQHLIDNNMQHLLSVHPSRLNSMVREEIEAGTFTVEEKPTVDPATGETSTVNVVKSSVLPGVSVYLKNSLGRTKSSRTKEKVS